MERDYKNTGVLFKNDNKKSGNHPDYSGSINFEGTEYWLSAWIKTGQKGKFMSLAIKPRVVKEKAKREPDPFQDNIDDDIPFNSAARQTALKTCALTKK